MHLEYLFSWKHLSNCKANPMFKLLNFLIPLSLHTIRPSTFLVWQFSYILPYFFSVNVYVILYCHLFQLIFHLSQPVCVFSVHHCLVPYITLKASTLLYIQYHTFKYVEQFPLASFNLPILPVLFCPTAISFQFSKTSS